MDILKKDYLIYQKEFNESTQKCDDGLEPC